MEKQSRAEKTIYKCDEIAKEYFILLKQAASPDTYSEAKRCIEEFLIPDREQETTTLEEYKINTFTCLECGRDFECATYNDDNNEHLIYCPCCGRKVTYKSEIYKTFSKQ